MAWIIASIPLWLAALVGVLFTVAGWLETFKEIRGLKTSAKDVTERLVGGFTLLSAASVFGATAAWMCS